MYTTKIQDLTLIMAPALKIYDNQRHLQWMLTHTLSFEHRGVMPFKSLQYYCCSYSLINRNFTISCQRKTCIWKCGDKILEIHYYILDEIP